ncbi:uncharacterized protein LOC135849767 [Planococcus citri]|uniref:uncharacterized protein LOC135849767 n=1 Tax=Planococcus citri TaxID=170843 RepID=UPI0031F91E14
MLSKKLISLYLRPKIPSNTSSRLLRGGYTFELKKRTPKAKDSDDAKRCRLKEIRKSNTGAGGALHLIEEREGKLNPDLDYDYIEDSTIGLENYHAQFQEKLQLSRSEFCRSSLNNIKRKYFMEPKLPNMVLYCEKQDMKLLHENDPENWDVEKLSESFPVTPEIAKKILRSPFTAYTVEQVKKHDQMAKRNWKLFNEGKLDLSPELRSHYEKFVDRVSFETPQHVIEKYLPSKPNFELNLKNKEFGSIVEKYELTKSKPSKIQIDPHNNKAVYEDTKFQPKMITEEYKLSSHKSVTLDKLRDNIKAHPERASELSKLIVEMEKKYLPASKSKPNVDIVPETDYLAEAEVVDKTYENSLPQMNDKFPLRIEIPKDQWKRNKLYQVEDRFYNDVGHFLYRVPGLFTSS